MAYTYKIEIIEGHDPDSYFWFRPVRIKALRKIRMQDIEEFSEEFSIEEDDVWRFLSYFLYKHYDEDLLYNRNRIDDGPAFEWNLAYNIYTYKSLRVMLEDISTAADLLETDYDNPALDKVKAKFPTYSISPHCSGAYDSNNPDAIRQNIGVIVDFYRRFADRLYLMMENNPETFLISIMGP